MARPAAALTARASARTGQHPRDRRCRDQVGASRTIAAVAATERANPASPGQPRVEEQQHADRRAQCGQRGAWTSRREGQQRDRPHGGGADDARARSRQHDETDQEEHRGDRLRAAVDGPPPERPQDRGEDDRHVRPGNRGEVGEPGALEVLVEHRVHRARVAHDEPRQQSGRTRVQDPPGGGGQSLAQRTRGLLQWAGAAQRRRRAPCGHHGDHVVARPRRGDRGPHPDRLTRQQVAPGVGGREEEHGGVQPVRDRPVGHRGDGRVRDDPTARRAAEHVRVGVQLDDEQDRPAGLGDGTER